MTDRHEIWKLLDELQMNNRADAAKLVTLRSLVAGLNLPTPSGLACPRCGLACKGPRTLAEHMHQLHGGPLPEHWKTGDGLVEPTAIDPVRARVSPSPGGVSPDAPLGSEGT